MHTPIENHSSKHFEETNHWETQKVEEFIQNMAFHQGKVCALLDANLFLILSKKI